MRDRLLPRDSDRGRGRGGDIDALLWPIQYSMYYMGFDVLPPYVAYGVQGHGFVHQDESAFLRELEARKAAWANRLETLDDTSPLSFPGWDEWDELGQYKGAA